MRISDWSSDVCSSDLATSIIGNSPTRRPIKALHATGPFPAQEVCSRVFWVPQVPPERQLSFDPRSSRPQPQPCRRPAPEACEGRPERFLSRPAIPYPLHHWRERSEEHTSELQSLMRI